VNVAAMRFGLFNHSVANRIENTLVYHSRMRSRLLVTVMATCVASVASDKGLCPPAPPKWSASPPTKSKASQEQDEGKASVTLMVVVSDKGFVCSAQVLNGINNETDTDAIAAVKTWTFKPATKDGRPVPVVVTVQVNYELANGKFMRAPKEPAEARP
jgi:protein TonB